MSTIFADTFTTHTKSREYIGVVEVEAGRIFLIGGKQSLREVVSFVPGLGNGRYEVYTESKHIPGFGDRITKVEIQCISDEEIQHLERQYSGFHTY
jgi:hypothetical protein